MVRPFAASSSFVILPGKYASRLESEESNARKRQIRILEKRNFSMMKNKEYTIRRTLGNAAEAIITAP
jgi:hypothetical protein